MAKAWNEMTPEEKREERFKNWNNPSGVKFNDAEAARKYQERTGRLKAAILGQEPDRVPVILPIGQFPAYYVGKNFKDMMYDYKALIEAWTRFMQDFKDDMDSFGGARFDLFRPRSGNRGL